MENKDKKGLGIIAGIGAVIAGLVLAMKAKAKAEPSVPPPEVNLAGSVFNKETGLPIEGVLVSIPTLSLQTTTNANGNFLFKNLRPNGHAIMFSKEGYGTYVTDGVQLNYGNNAINIGLVPIKVLSPTSYLIQLQNRLEELVYALNKWGESEQNWFMIPVYGLQPYLWSTAELLKNLMLQEARAIGYSNPYFSDTHLFANNVQIV